MGIEWMWWIAAAILIGAELVSGTFYLLAVGIAVALGGVAAWLGAGLPVQFAVAGVLGVALTIAAHRWRLARASPPLQPLARRRTGGPRRDLERRRHRARRLSRHVVGRRARRRPVVPRAETLYIVATRGSVLVLSDRRPFV